MSTEFQGFIAGHLSASAAMHYLDSISVGLNGEVDLTLPASSLATIVLPTAEASVIYDGSNQTLYMHANSINPLANTPIASFLPNSTTSFDGKIDFANGQFRFTAAEDFSFAGANVNGQLTLSNSGLVLEFDTTVDESVSYGPLTASFDVSMTDTLSIQFSSNGDLSFALDVTGSATASFSGHKWSSGNLSYSWSGQGKLASLESQTTSDSSYILNNVWNDVEGWLKGLASSIWQCC